MKIVNSFFALVLVFVTLQASSANRIKGGKQKQRRRLDKAPSERECEISAKHDDEVEFECKAKTENDVEEIKDEIEFEVSVSSLGLSLKVEYEKEIETDEVERESETQYKVLFDRLIEYKSSNSNNDAYDWVDDVVVKTTELTEWAPFSEVVTDAEGITSTFSVKSEDETVDFTFTVSRADISEAINANHIKLDFTLSNYQWAQSDTNVALICSIESRSELEIDYEAKEEEDVVSDVMIGFGDALDDIGFTPFGEFTWVEVADVHNSTTGVNSTVEVLATTSPATTQMLADGVIQVEYMAFSFVGEAAMSAEEIYWDPEAGIGYGSSSSAPHSMLSFGLVAGIFSMLFAAY